MVGEGCHDGRASDEEGGDDVGGSTLVGEIHVPAVAEGGSGRDFGYVQGGIECDMDMDAGVYQDDGDNEEEEGEEVPREERMRIVRRSKRRRVQRVIT